MTETEAKDKLFEIMDAVENTGGYYNCTKCVFYNILAVGGCPFDECPTLWEVAE